MIALPTRRRGVDFPRSTWIYAGGPWCAGPGALGAFFVHEEVNMQQRNDEREWYEKQWQEISECEVCRTHKLAPPTTLELATHWHLEHDNQLGILRACIALKQARELGLVAHSG